MEHKCDNWVRENENTVAVGLPKSLCFPLIEPTIPQTKPYIPSLDAFILTSIWTRIDFPARIPNYNYQYTNHFGRGDSLFFVCVGFTRKKTSFNDSHGFEFSAQPIAQHLFHIEFVISSWTISHVIGFSWKWHQYTCVYSLCKCEIKWTMAIITFFTFSHKNSMSESAQQMNQQFVSSQMAHQRTK